MNVLLTGAAGFIGSHVARVLLERGHAVTAVLRPADDNQRLASCVSQLAPVEVDLEDSHAVRTMVTDLRPSACIHLAWYVEPGIYLRSRRNLDALAMTLRLFDELLSHGCRQVVAAGTCAEYRPKEGLIDEDDAARPATLYAAAKLSVELVARQLAASAGARFAWARLFYLYGPGEDDRRLVPSVIQALLAGRPFPATAGEQLRDYLHVHDVATAFVTLLEQNADGVFNVCSGVPITVRELLESTGRIVGRPQLVHVGELPYRDWEPPSLCGNNARLRRLGWKPEFALQEGLTATADWWKRLLL